MMDKFQVLQTMGAGDFQHLNGSLEAHLKGTAKLLADWGASETLQVAGLFHAAYGTAGFDERMVALKQRKGIAKLLGEPEEALVYLYCSCDRDFVFPQFAHTEVIKFKDRFTGQIFPLDENSARLFCELTVANELELVTASEAFKTQYGAALLTLFDSMQRYLSKEAKEAYLLALANG